MVRKYFRNGDCDSFNKFYPPEKTLAVNSDLQSSSIIYEYISRFTFCLLLPFSFCGIPNELPVLDIFSDFSKLLSEKSFVIS